MINLSKIESAVLGHVIGDAVGVPHEFKSRTLLAANPATDMYAFGSHNQPRGTWSDDSSLMLALLEALGKEYSLEHVAQNFINWRDQRVFTARGEVFDIGMTTNVSINRLKKMLTSGDIEGLNRIKYLGDESDNGNGSLMRILPLAFYIYKAPLKHQWEKTWEISALTHPHFRAAMACFIYNKIIEKLIDGFSNQDAYNMMCEEILLFWNCENFSGKELEILIGFFRVKLRCCSERKLILADM